MGVLPLLRASYGTPLLSVAWIDSLSQEDAGKVERNTLEVHAALLLSSSQDASSHPVLSQPPPTIVIRDSSSDSPDGDEPDDKSVKTGVSIAVVVGCVLLCIFIHRRFCGGRLRRNRRRFLQGGPVLGDSRAPFGTVGQSPSGWEQWKETQAPGSSPQPPSPSLPSTLSHAYHANPQHAIPAAPNLRISPSPPLIHSPYNLNSSPAPSPSPSSLSASSSTAPLFPPPRFPPVAYPPSGGLIVPNGNSSPSSLSPSRSPSSPSSPHLYNNNNSTNGPGTHLGRSATQTSHVSRQSRASRVSRASSIYSISSLTTASGEDETDTYAPEKVDTGPEVPPPTYEEVAASTSRSGNRILAGMVPQNSRS